MNGSGIKTLRDQDVVIPCEITEYGDQKINIKSVSVQWIRKLPDGSTKNVYMFDSRTHQSYRPGSNITDSELIKGNAGLHIPKIQFSDEGEYHCIVFYTPNKAQGKTVLKVMAQPTTTLTPNEVSVEVGTEKSVTCEASGFYPQTIKIWWVEHLSPSRYVTLEKNTCTETAVTNTDETLNVTSHLTLNPSLEDDGKLYSCIVEHGSLKKEQVLDFILSVKEPDDKGRVILVSIVVTAVIILIIFIFVGGYLKFLKTEPPTVSQITGNEHLIHMNKATLSCQITGFRPKPIEITVCLKRSGKPLEEIDTWSDEKQRQDNKSNIPSDDHMNIETEKVRMLRNSETAANSRSHKPLQIETNADVKSSHYRMYNCPCSIHITPNIDEDNEAEFIIQVKHAALKAPIYVSCPLKVIGVHPKLSRIVPPLRILHEEPLTLTCPINGFKPKPLSITWLKVDSFGHKTELLTCKTNEINYSISDNSSKYSHNLSMNEHEDHSYSCLSVLIFKPKIKEDDGTKYICRTYHPSTDKHANQEMDMLVSAVPELDPIQNTQEVVYVGDNIDLSCKIHSFFPQPLDVMWYKNDEPLPFNNDEVLIEANGLLYFKSRLTYTPTVKDLGKEFRCEVKHQSLGNPKQVAWKLANLIATPNVNNIQCDPNVPECNTSAKLSCRITGFYPEHCMIRWYRGILNISTEYDQVDTQQDTASGLFYRTAQLQITPSIKDHETEFRIEVTHCKKTITRTFYIKLKGLPNVQDIRCDKTFPKYGDPVTLCCSVDGCNPDVMSAEWQENNIPIKRYMTPEKCVNNGIVSFLLKLTPTAEHHGKLIACLVKHKDMAEPIRKNISLKLPEKAPNLSEITVHPANPEVNREVCFKISISGFAPKDLQVEWFKSFTKFTGDIENSKPEIEKDGLYSCTSKLRLTLTEDHYNMPIRCVITHTASKKTQEKRFILSLKGSSCGPSGNAANISPIIRPANEKKQIQTTGIQCLTVAPRMGQPVTLSCSIPGWDVNDGFFTWYNGIFPVDEDQIENANQTDGCISKVTFTPESKDSNIKFEATFNFETIEENYNLKLV
ncbi:natural cytotoxicity triggering receptor 3 ligand 1 [Rhinophrynus dorsalis]